MQGDYFFLPVEHVIFGTGSLERLKVRRALTVRTFRPLREVFHAF